MSEVLLPQTIFLLLPLLTDKHKYLRGQKSLSFSAAAYFRGNQLNDQRLFLIGVNCFPK
jgi:hypothetical protein